jgi:hypothetical protein
MTALITEADVSTDAIIATLSGDSELNNIELTVNGTQRKLQGVFYLVAPQEQSYPYPSVIVNQPITRSTGQRMHPNGPQLVALESLQQVWLQARDVEPNDANLRRMRARVIALLAGKTIAVTGGRAISCRIENFPADQRVDNGDYVYTRTGVTFLIAAQLM